MIFFDIDWDVGFVDLFEEIYELWDVLVVNKVDFGIFDFYGIMVGFNLRFFEIFVFFGLGFDWFLMYLGGVVEDVYVFFEIFVLMCVCYW